MSVLRDCGQTALAKLTAKTYGLDEIADEMSVDADDIKPCSNNKSSLMMPPVPVFGEEDIAWPHLPVARGLFQRDPGAEEDFEEPTGDYYEDAAAFEASERDPNWEDDRKVNAAPVVDPFAVGLSVDDGAAVNGEDAWGGDFDIDDGGLGEELAGDVGFGIDEKPVDGIGAEPTYYVPPTAGLGAPVRWARSSKLAGELAAAGAFEEAMKLLIVQIGVGSFAPMKEAFMNAYAGCRGSLDAAQTMPLNTLYIPRPTSIESCAIAVTLPLLRERFSVAQQRFQSAKFADAIKLFTSIITSIPLLVVNSNKEVEDCKSALNMAREYLTGLRLEGEGRKARAERKDEGRQVQLAGLFSKCSMKPLHVQLALRAAMKTAYETQNLGHAAGFARRLLELSPAQALAQSARKVMQICDRNMSNKNEIDYDERREFVVECGALVPLYSGEPKESCPYCQAAYAPEFKDRICHICTIGKVGARGEGLRVYA